MSQLLLPIHSLDCLLTAWRGCYVGRVTSELEWGLTGRLACVTSPGQASSSGLAQHSWPWPCTLRPPPYQFCTYGDRNGDNNRWGEKQERVPFSYKLYLLFYEFKKGKEQVFKNEQILPPPHSPTPTCEQARTQGLIWVCHSVHLPIWKGMLITYLWSWVSKEELVYNLGFRSEHTFLEWNIMISSFTLKLTLRKLFL